MGISGIPNPEALKAGPVPGGWSIGWWTGWWNPFDALREIDPRVVGELTIVQGDLLAKQIDLQNQQAELVREMGRNIAAVQQG